MATLRQAVNVQLTNAAGQTFAPKHDQREDLTASAPDTDLFLWAVTTAELDLTLNTVTAGGLLLLTNLDDANFITYGVKSGGIMVALCTLQPGETHKLRLEAAATLRAAADTATVTVQVAAIDA